MWITWSRVLSISRSQIGRISDTYLKIPYLCRDPLIWPSDSMPSSLSSTCLASSSPLLYVSVLASQSGSISASPQTSITRSSSITSLSLLASSFSPKSYLTIYDFFIRYTFLKSLIKSITPIKVLLPRVLLPIILKDLFNKFALKISIITLNPPLSAKIPSPPAP